MKTVVVIFHVNVNPYTGVRTFRAAVADDGRSARQWIQDEVDGKHEDGWDYAPGHDVDWWLDQGIFVCEVKEVFQA